MENKSYPLDEPERNFTMVDNDFWDDIMPKCSSAEWMVISVIYRKTRGWHKNEDQISYSKLKQFTGIKATETLKNAVDGLEEKGFILVERGEEGKSNLYKLNREYAIPSQKILLPQSENLTTPSKKILHTKETIKNTIKESNVPASSGEQKEIRFPPDVEVIVNKVCGLWMLTPPTTRDSRYKFWIKSARELKEACGEYGVDEILEEIHEEWEGKKWDVASPASLINSAVARVGRRRVNNVPVYKPGGGEDATYHWNSELSSEENLRLMRFKRQETNHDKVPAPAQP